MIFLPLYHMLPASMFLDLKYPGYACYVMVMYLACDLFLERHLTTLDSTFFLKIDARNQGNSGRLKCICTASLTQRCIHKPNLRFLCQIIEDLCS